MKKAWIFLLMTVFSCGEGVKPESEERTLYQGEGVNIKARTAGLPKDIRKLYMTVFSDKTGDRDTVTLQREIDRLSREKLGKLGVSFVERIFFAQAVVTGVIESYTISDAKRVTNIDGWLLYKMEVSYSVIDKNSQFLQEDKSIREVILVTDTNKYLSNAVVAVLLENLTTHLCEAIFYGWQIDYSKTDTKIFTLGD